MAGAWLSSFLYFLFRGVRPRSHIRTVQCHLVSSRGRAAAGQVTGPRPRPHNNGGPGTGGRQFGCACPPGRAAQGPGLAGHGSQERRSRPLTWRSTPSRPWWFSPPSPEAAHPHCPCRPGPHSAELPCWRLEVAACSPSATHSGFNRAARVRGQTARACALITQPVRGCNPVSSVCGDWRERGRILKRAVVRTRKRWNSREAGRKNRNGSETGMSFLTLLEGACSPSYQAGL